MIENEKVEVKMDENKFDAKGVLDEFVVFKNSLKLANENKRSALARNVSIFIWLFGIAITILTYFVGKKHVAIPTDYVLMYLVVLLVSLVSMLVCIYLDMVETKDFIKDPVSDVLGWSGGVILKETKLYSKFNEYPIEALVHVRNYLRRKKTLIESISSMLVGVLTKIGLAPAILATIFTMVKLNSDGGSSPFSILGFVLIGLYLFSFRLIETSVKLDEYQSIINDYIEMRENR